MNQLQTLLGTTKPTDELSCWAFAFEILDGRCEYSSAVYKVVLEALACSRFHGQLLVFAADVFGWSRNPVYLVQLVPVTHTTAKGLRGPGYGAFQEFVEQVDVIARADAGLAFAKDAAEIGSAMTPVVASILRGHVRFFNGLGRRIHRVEPAEPTLFEQAFLECFPDVQVAG